MHAFELASCDGFAERTIQVDRKEFTCVFVADGQMRPLAQQSIGLADVIVLTYRSDDDGMEQLQWWLHECLISAAAGRRPPIVLLRFAYLGEAPSLLETERYSHLLHRRNVSAHHEICCSGGAFDREHPDFEQTSETFDQVLTSAVRAFGNRAPARPQNVQRLVG